MNDRSPSEDTLDWSQRRKAKDISLAHIAERTNISVKKLEALENGRFDELGSETFVTGYIRAYAKIVQEDVDGYLEVFRRSAKKHDVMTQEVAAVGQSRGPVHKTWKKFGLLHLSVSVIVLWILMVFILGGDTPEEKALSADTTGVEETDLAMEEVSAEPIASPPTDPEVTEEEEVIAAPVAELSSPAAEQILSSLDDQEVPQSVEETPPSPGIASEDVLILSFSEDCWTEVRENEGRVLVAELKRKGDNLQLFGQAPFNVMLGNARAVTLSLNGETISTVPPGNRKTLRLVVE